MHTHRAREAVRTEAGESDTGVYRYRCVSGCMWCVCVTQLTLT
jgi:hypothetical protein